MKAETKKALKVFAVVTAVAAVGYGLYRAVTAAAPPVVCTPGEEKCIGPNWCRCNAAGTKWIVVTPNATQCAVPPGEPDMRASGPLADSWRVGDTVYIWGSAWVFNDGDGAGEYIEEWYIDDVLVGTNEGYLAPGAYDNNEKIWYNSDLGLAPGEHGLHVVLKWNGHEDRYPSSGYRTFVVPA